MRMLGTKSTLSVFRWDLVCLFSTTSADERPEVQALAAPVQAAIAELRSERDAHETIEDLAVVTTARRGKRDATLDDLIKRFGGVARARDKDVYDAAFDRYNPSATARLALGDEVKEVDRIIGEVQALAVDHPLRVEYEQPLTTAQTALKDAIRDAGLADTSLALSRSRLERFKVRLDKLRLETHGRLLTIVQNKVEAESFFRSTTKAPGSDSEEEEPQGPAAPAPDPAAG